MNTKPSTEQQKELAKTLYVNEDTPNEQIAASVGIDIATLEIWLEEGNWKPLKKAMLTSRQKQLRHYYNQLEMVNESLGKDDGNDTKKYDQIVKLTAAIKNLETGNSVAEIVEVFVEFATWLKRRNKNMLTSVMPYLDLFVNHKMDGVYNAE